MPFRDWFRLILYSAGISVFVTTIIYGALVTFADLRMWASQESMLAWWSYLGGAIPLLIAVL